jgi:DNA polymerase-3 subunit gamma/tau
MNQCDINYRQSSNKRLLVELTLIEIAQITQPDEGAGSGRRPKRLKNLFRNLILQPQTRQTAPQVAVAESKAKPQKAAEPEVPAQQAPVVKERTTLKLGNIGTSWQKLRQGGTPSKMNILAGTLPTSSTDENVAFTQDDLELQWLSMCNRMPQRQAQLIGIATRMKNMTPTITTLPQVEVVVANELVKEEMERIRGAIMATLKAYLHNSHIELTLRVADYAEQQVKVLTRREQFELLSQQNPSVEKLREVFDLELA